ncbi:MAG TPA: DUF4037 domain-containing protein [Clostridia bacterium]|nr:DUF4037 domain-containing protein [Clostridia bacterium]
MNNTTEKTFEALINRISKIQEVQSIGISGGKSPLPAAGEGDIDIFIYCDKLPELEKREAVINELGGLLQDSKINVFQGGHWGSGDFTLINGVETWLMYFTAEEALCEVEAILKGECPDKLDNYYYPVGRLAMLKNMSILYDKNNLLNSLQIRLSEYPEELSGMLVNYHMAELEDTEDLERAVTRKDVLFYHFALDIALDHFLQALFAVNKVFFPSRKRSLEIMSNFKIIPVLCNERLLEVIKLGSYPEHIGKSYALWSKLVDELRVLCDM